LRDTFIEAVRGWLPVVTSANRRASPRGICALDIVIRAYKRPELFRLAVAEAIAGGKPDRAVAEIT